MHITLTQSEMAVAVRTYLQTTLPSLNVDTADIAINDNGEAEIAITSIAQQPEVKSDTSAEPKKRRSRKLKADPVPEPESTPAESVDTEVAAAPAEDTPWEDADTAIVNDDITQVPFGLEDTKKSTASLFGS